MSSFIKNACMDVLFEHKAHIGNITISIEPETAIRLNVSDEIVFTKECFPTNNEEEIKVFNTKSSPWSHLSINYFYLVDYMEYYTKIYPQDRQMIIKIERKFYLYGSTIQFIARVQHPDVKSK